MPENRPKQRQNQQSALLTQAHENAGNNTFYVTVPGQSWAILLLPNCLFCVPLQTLFRIFSPSGAVNRRPLGWQCCREKRFQPTAPDGVLICTPMRSEGGLFSGTNRLSPLASLVPCHPIPFAWDKDLITSPAFIPVLGSSWPLRWPSGNALDFSVTTPHLPPDLLFAPLMTLATLASQLAGPSCNLCPPPIPCKCSTQG